MFAVSVSVLISMQHKNNHCTWDKSTMIVIIISLEICRSSNSLWKSAMHREWIDSTLPPAPKKWAVGWPCKDREVPEPLPVCVRQDDEHLRWKYKAYTVKGKEDIIAKSVTFGVWATCQLYSSAPAMLNSSKKQGLVLQHGKGSRRRGGGSKLTYAVDVDEQLL